MKKRVAVVVFTLVCAFGMAVPVAAAAGGEPTPCDGDTPRGNHAAIWTNPVHHHENGDPLTSGSEWGEYVSYNSTDGYFQGSGAAPNVHLQKCQSVPGQDS